GAASTGGATATGGTASTGGATATGGVTGAGGSTTQPNGATCSTDGDCSSGNCVGGSCCQVACDSPGTCQRQTGTRCVNGTTCRYAKELDDTACDDGDACTNAVCFDGACVVDSVKDCSDQDRCTTDACDPATGTCSHDPIDVATACTDQNPCTTDSCDPAQGCVHADDNQATCTDGDACTIDACSGGLCVSTPRDCSNLDRDCRVGVCVNGTCQGQPRNSGGACDDGLDACSATGKCNASGTCVDQRDACGPLAASCAFCSSGAQCYQGRDCTCAAAGPGQPPNIEVAGTCVPDTNECNANPCVATATCNDPTPGATPSGDYQCTCPPGTTGNGRKSGNGCTDVNECATNPCGPGSAVLACDGTTPLGSYTCTCRPGFRSIQTPTGPTCVCDMGGTYAVVTTNRLSWSPIVGPNGQQAIEGSPQGGVAATGWALRHHAIAADGTMTITTIPCGGTAPELCDTALTFAHAQYQPNQVWGKAKMATTVPVYTVPTAGVRPGGSLVEPEIGSLMGIALDDPLGAWPPCRQCVGVNVGQTCTCPGKPAYTVTNKATWADPDEDGRSGVTSYDVSRGGDVINATFPDPPIDYPQPSECPRIAGGTKYNYSEWPGYDTNNEGFRAYQWYGASRIISRYNGTTVTLNTGANKCEVTGTVTGPDAGGTRAHTDARVQGCETCSDNFIFYPDQCRPDDACDAAETDSYDGAAQTQQVLSSNFQLRALPSVDLGAILALPLGAARETALVAACQTVRETYCPAGESCN
ncbi:MAG: hypothetical protein FJ104_03585, partial [Deltaproteobacteria bacterium]|nr:hypothetical protein [Deltaproteobacteria bacterium]